MTEGHAGHQLTIRRRRVAAAVRRLRPVPSPFRRCFRPLDASPSSTAAIGRGRRTPHWPHSPQCRCRPLACEPVSAVTHKSQLTTHHFCCSAVCSLCTDTESLRLSQSHTFTLVTHCSHCLTETVTLDSTFALFHKSQSQVHNFTDVSYASQLVLQPCRSCNLKNTRSKRGQQ